MHLEWVDPVGLAAQRPPKSNISAKEGGSAAGAGPPVGAVEELVPHRALAGTQGVLGGTHRTRGHSQYSQCSQYGGGPTRRRRRRACAAPSTATTRPSLPAEYSAVGGYSGGTPGVLPEYSMGTPGVLQKYSMGTDGYSRSTLWVQRGTPGVLVPPPGVPLENQWSTPEYSRGVRYSSTHAPSSAERREKSSSSGYLASSRALSAALIATAAYTSTSRSNSCAR